MPWGRVCLWIKCRKRVFAIARMTAEEFRKAVIVEQGAGFEDGVCNGVELVD